MQNSSRVPQIVVKKEPTSPEPPSTARHRPPKLSLAKNGSTAASGSTPRTGVLTADRGLMHEVGMACLSPGFATHDPAMREQLQRSMSVRDAQRSIIESRLNRHANGPEGGKDRDDGPPSARGNDKPPGSARRRGPPSNLTIVPPPHRAFANERVVQSAPLNQSFTGRHQPLHHHHHNQHMHHPSHLPPPSNQVNRLPPITDVFGPEKLDGSRSARPDVRPYFPTSRPSYPSPNSLAHNRPREYSSAEEAVQQMAGGREDMLPRLVHYSSSNQPPTPPSPTMPHSSHPHAHHPAKMAPMNGTMNSSSSSRRRGRAEYERDGSYGSDNDTQDQRDYKRRKEEDRKKRAAFLDLCGRAWDLLHS